MSSSWNSIAQVVRTVMFSIIILFSFFIMCIDAHIAHVLSQVNIVAGGNVASMVIAILTLITLPALLAISITQKGHVVNMIAIELGIMAVLWILWIVGSAMAGGQFVLDCGFTFIDNGNTLNCSEPLAVQAFAWLNWIIITKYILILLVLSIIQHSRGNQVWTKPVNNVDLFAPRAVFVTTAPMYGQNTGVYVQQQPATQVYTTQPAQMAYPPASGAVHTPKAGYQV